MDFRELFAVSKRRDTRYDSAKAQKVNHFLFDLVLAELFQTVAVMDSANTRYPF